MPRNAEPDLANSAAEALLQTLQHVDEESRKINEAGCLENFHPKDQIIPETYMSEQGLEGLHRSPCICINHQLSWGWQSAVEAPDFLQRGSCKLRTGKYVYPIIV